MGSLPRITHIITGLADGGAEAVLYRLVTTDTSGTRHVVVSLGDAGKYGPMLQSLGVNVHALDMPRGRLTTGGLVRLYRLLRRERPDVVQTWMYHANLVGGIAARLAGCRRVFWGIHHTNLGKGTTGFSTRMVDWVCARLSRLMPYGIVACAESARQVHVARGYWPGKFCVIPNGYDLSHFRPDIASRHAVRRELGLDAHVALIGLVGRWHPSKDHANLLKAFAHLQSSHPESRLLLAGTQCDAGNAELGQLISNLGLNGVIHLLGARPDVPAIMNALDLHVLSSSGEAFPNVVAEAMACGTPCVVTDVGDAAVMVGETGWVVPPSNSDRLAKAIAAALDERQDPARWAERCKRARQRIIDNYSVERMVARYHDLWSARDPAESRIGLNCHHVRALQKCSVIRGAGEKTRRGGFRP